MVEYRNPSEDGIIQQLAEKRAGNFDIEISEAGTFTADLTDDGEVHFTHGEHNLVPTGSALSQMLTRNEVPGTFFAKCPIALKRAILQSFCNGKLYRLRATKNGGCRAVMSKGYKPFDDHQLFPITLDELAEQEVFNHKTFRYDDHITVLTTAINDENTELPYYACITVSNSETGHSSVWIEPSIIFKDSGLQIANRQALRNRMSRFVHRGVITEQDIKDAMAIAKEVAQIGLIQLMEAAEEVVTVDAATAFMAEMDFFPKRFAQIIEEDLQNEKEIHKLELVKRIIKQASELPLVQQIAVEQASGKFLKLFNNASARIEQLAAEMSQ